MRRPPQLMSAGASCCEALRVAIVLKIHLVCTMHAQAAATDERTGKLLWDWSERMVGLAPQHVKK